MIDTGSEEGVLDQWAELNEASRRALTVALIESHNHISPPLSLGTGIDKEEAWSHQVGDFIDSLRS